MVMDVVMEVVDVDKDEGVMHVVVVWSCLVKSSRVVSCRAV